MGKKKGKKKKKRSKKRDDGPKKPSRRSILEAKVAELDDALATTSRHLEEQESILESWKTRLREEVEVEEACVSHLRRNLQAKTEEGVELQGNLARLREKEKEVGEKFDEMTRRLESGREEEQRNFLQRHSEMEDKLFGLEQRKQKRFRQLARLKKAEESLADKTTVQLEKDRQEDMRQVKALLQRRDKFCDLVDDIVADHEKVFKIQLPAYAKEQVRDNIRFRTQCQDAAEDLLSAQDRNRHLKNLQEALQIKTEVQESAEKDMKSLARRVLNRLDDLLRGKDIHRPIEVEYMAVMKLEIGQMEREMEHIQTEIEEVNATLEDQDQYKSTLEMEIEKNSEGNGFLVSKILRASQIFKGRVSEIQGTEKVDMDTQVLHQIKMILEDE